jgi:hypothetical protein
MTSAYLTTAPLEARLLGLMRKLPELHCVTALSHSTLFIELNQFADG